MRKFILLCVMLYLCWGANAQTQRYHVTGTAEGTVDDDTIYLAVMTGFFQLAPTDTAIVKNGAFAFNGTIDGADMRVAVAMHKGQMIGMTDFILENAPISLQIYPQDSNKKPIVKGGQTQKLYDEVTKEDEDFSKLMDKPYEQANDSTLPQDIRNKAKAQLDSLRKISTNRHFEFIMAHIPSPISDMLLQWYAQDMTETQVNAILNKMTASGIQYQYYKQIMAERRISKATAVGQHYTDIVLKGIDGKTDIQLSAYINKNRYTLLDFWASWCGPCRAEMPNVVKVYKLYHNKGLEVVGVSLDNNREAWVKAISTLKMPWPQMSDLKGWKSTAAAAYNIRAIPANVLIDNKGNIIAKDLRGEELLKKMEELMK
ncbi:MAG: TlpA disulfide reductase family protein [Prevotella sp.]|nr:TlpA disulfide reductase family protein [Prevotella sp.]